MSAYPPSGSPAPPASPASSVIPLDQVALDPVVVSLPDGDLCVTFGTPDRTVTLLGPPVVIASALADVVQAVAEAMGVA